MDSSAPRRTSWKVRGALAVILGYVLVILALMWWWDTEPDYFDPIKATQELATPRQQAVVVGTATTSALIRSTQVMLDKRGGYLSNDKLPPGVLMDNIPNWEFGVVTASRDLTRALRNEFSRSQTQSVEDKDLQEAEPLISSPNDRWLLPSSESQYRKAIAVLCARRQSGRFSFRGFDAHGLALATPFGECRPGAHRY